MQNKHKAKIQWYYTANKLLEQIYNSRKTMNEIYKPEDDQSAILLTKYLIPFLDIFNTIHPERKEYNKFAYDYIFDSENVSNNHPTLYVIKNINSPEQYIEKLSLDEMVEFLKGYSLTITGCVFTKHDEYEGLFTETLKSLKQMRSDYKGNMYKYPKGSDSFNFWNSRQLSVKIAMNSIYGIMGLKTFRYSNHWLAQSVTTSGRLAIKLAQFLSENHLKEKFKGDK